MVLLLIAAGVAVAGMGYVTLIRPTVWAIVEGSQPQYAFQVLSPLG